MRELVALIITIILGVFAYAFFNASKEPEAKPGAALVETRLPLSPVLSVGSDTLMVVGGRAYRYGVSVVSDSRCPKGAQCPRAGEGLVVAWVRPAGGAKEEVRLMTTDKAPKPFGPTAIRVTDLSPYPEVGKTIGREQYRVALEITKN